VEQQKFRLDLYYRLKVVTLVMPPLRERKEDIPLLVWHFLAGFADEHQRPTLEVSPEAMQALVRYSWPGNVRELKNLIENLVIFSKQPVVQLPDLPAEVREQSASDLPPPTRFEELNMSTIEKQAILQALEKTSGNRLKAAQLLGIGLRTLQTKLKEYGMTER
jgi:two-component system, NtrC family, response regulator AtoC